MTVLNIKSTTTKTKEYIGSTIIKDGFTIQYNMDDNFEIFGSEGDILLITKDHHANIIENADEEIEISTYDEFLEWWPSIKKGLGMKP